MKRSLIIRGGLALGVLAFVAGPLTAVTATAATAAKHHKHHAPPPPPPPVTTPPGPTVGPAVVVTGDLTELSNDGGVGFTLEGSGWYANEPIQLASPGMTAGCPGFFGFYSTVFPDVNPLTLTTDFSGDFNVGVGGDGCSPGAYQVTAQETTTPNRVATTSLVITAPAVLATGVTLSPASEVETGTSGQVVDNILVSGLNANEPLNFASPSLSGACSGA